MKAVMVNDLTDEKELKSSILGGVKTSVSPTLV